MSTIPKISIGQAVEKFTRKYHDGQGIYSVGQGRLDGKDCIGVMGTPGRLKSLPDIFNGYKVKKTPGTQPTPLS